jgi:hypothetical protein
MKSILRNTLLGAVGLVALSLSAHAAGSTAVTDSPLFNSTTADLIKMAQRNENPGGAGFRNENPGGPGFRNENPGGPGFRNENPGGPGFHKKAKKKKHVTK